MTKRRIRNDYVVTNLEHFCWRRKPHCLRAYSDDGLQNVTQSHRDHEFHNKVIMVLIISERGEKCLVWVEHCIYVHP